MLIKTALVFAKTEVISGRQFQATDRTIGSTQVEHRSRVQKKSFKKRDRHFEKKKRNFKGRCNLDTHIYKAYQIRAGCTHRSDYNRKLNNRRGWLKFKR